MLCFGCYVQVGIFILRLNSTIKYINIEKHRTELFTLYGVLFWAPNRLLFL